MYISVFSGSDEEQSASFPGNPPPSRADFLLTRSLAFREASLARAAAIALFTITSPRFGYDSKYSFR